MNKNSLREDVWWMVYINFKFTFWFALLIIICATMYIVIRAPKKQVNFFSLCIWYIFCAFMCYGCTIAPAEMMFMVFFIYIVMSAALVLAVKFAEPRI